MIACQRAPQRFCVYRGYSGPIYLDWRANLQPGESITEVSAVEVGSGELLLTNPGPNLVTFWNRGEEVEPGQAAVVECRNVSEVPGLYVIRFGITSLGAYQTVIQYEVELEMS